MELNLNVRVENIEFTRRLTPPAPHNPPALPIFFNFKIFRIWNHRFIKNFSSYDYLIIPSKWFSLRNVFEKLRPSDLSIYICCKTLRIRDRHFSLKRDFSQMCGFWKIRDRPWPYPKMTFPRKVQVTHSRKTLNSRISPIREIRELKNPARILQCFTVRYWEFLLRY